MTIMKKNVRLVLLCLLVQAFFTAGTPLWAQVAPGDTLIWTWEVTNTVSTRTKTFVLEFTDSVYVNWGDGVGEWFADSLSKKTLTHVYTGTGTYSCTVSGSAITYFKAESRRLLSLITEKAPNLTYISCTSSQLTTLDLSRNTKLESLYCASNDLAYLDLSENTQLQTLTCSDNKLTYLDVSGLQQLKKVTCHTNPITELKVSSTGNLSYLSCSSCNLSAQALDSLFRQLPVLSTVAFGQNLIISGNPGTDTCHLEWATAKKWTPDNVKTKNAVYIPAVNVKMGQTAVVPVYLDNIHPIVAFEMDLSLPDGLILDTLQTALAAERIGNHFLSVAKLSTTSAQYKLLAYSMTSKDTLKACQGAVLNLFIQVPDSLRTYTIDIKKVILADTTAHSADVTLTDGKLTVQAVYTQGDANNDECINVTDVVWLIAIINERVSPECRKEAVDMDGNGVWNILDVVRLIDVINTSDDEGALLVATNKVESQLRASRGGGIFLPQAYNAYTASGSNHLYLSQTPDDLSTIHICLDNKETVQAMQTDIILPEHTMLLPEATRLSPRCTSTHTFSLVPITRDTNRYRLMIWSMTPDEPVSGGKGIVVSLGIRNKEVKSGSSKEPLRGKLQYTVLTGMNRATLTNYSYETELLRPGQQALTGVTVGSGPDGVIWVMGENLEHVAIYDLTGRLVTEKACFGNPTCSATVGPGCYVVKVRKGTSSIGVFKVLVS